MKILYEILVPTIYGDTLKPIRTVHHKQWDKYIQSITGGLTILSSARGKWTHEGVEYPEKVIPVRVMISGCDETDVCLQLQKIVHFTLSHYRQKAVMYYMVSSQVHVVYAIPTTGGVVPPAV